MREIKFRAWNETEQKMTTPFAWVNESNLFSTCMCSAPTHELMQFTEMRDGYGKDIYEFDIVLFNDGEFSFYGVVNFSEYGYVISIDDKNKESLFEFNTPELKVIGNIHQHAYLLEQNKC